MYLTLPIFFKVHIDFDNHRGHLLTYIFQEVVPYDMISLMPDHFSQFSSSLSLTRFNHDLFPSFYWYPLFSVCLSLFLFLFLICSLSLSLRFSLFNQKLSTWCYTGQKQFHYWNSNCILHFITGFINVICKFLIYYVSAFSCDFEFWSINLINLIQFFSLFSPSLSPLSPLSHSISPSFLLHYWSVFRTFNFPFYPLYVHVLFTLSLTYIVYSLLR